MYESPIELIISEMHTKLVEEEERRILKGVQDIGINVDKDELIKALAYDRGQYEKGYADRDKELVRCKDCKWRGHWGCALRIVNDGDKPKDDDFCSFGEREEERAMTRGEAIRHIRDVIAENNSIKPNFVTFEQEKEALHMAIEALSADRPKNMIRIDDVYRLIAGHSNYHGDSILSAFTCLVEGKDVKPIAPLDESADRPTGEWIKTEHCLNDTGCRRWIEIECPYCGERPTYEFLENMNYCPNCGAKMGGDSDG